MPGSQGLVCRREQPHRDDRQRLSVLRLLRALAQHASLRRARQGLAGATQAPATVTNRPAQHATYPLNAEAHQAPSAPCCALHPHPLPLAISGTDCSC
eukprot:6181686-Pleurochrysis_carterae.AAC.1